MTGCMFGEACAVYMKAIKSLLCFPISRGGLPDRARTLFPSSVWGRVTGTECRRTWPQTVHDLGVLITPSTRRSQAAIFRGKRKSRENFPHSSRLATVDSGDELYCRWNFLALYGSDCFLLNQSVEILIQLSRSLRLFQCTKCFNGQTLNVNLGLFKTRKNFLWDRKVRQKYFVPEILTSEVTRLLKISKWSILFIALR